MQFMNIKSHIITVFLNIYKKKMYYIGQVHITYINKELDKFTSPNGSILYTEMKDLKAYVDCIFFSEYVFRITY